jgi:FKBP-type peptidyl-prolyl cis-trans isomerase FklB
MGKRIAALSLMAGAGLFLATGCTAGGTNPETRPELTTLKDRVSYSIGLNIGTDFKAQGMDIDADLLALGIKDAVADAEPLLSEEQIRETIMAYQQEMMEKQETEMRGLAEKNRQEGEAFLAANAQKEGVVTLPSGLQYRVVEDGTGATPGPQDVVTVHYEGRLIDGEVFDSSRQRGEPATFPVTGVIPGWTEALQLMKKGAKWELFIPADLAYGERGAHPVIGPNAVLIFDVELLEVHSH